VRLIGPHTCIVVFTFIILLFSFPTLCQNISDSGRQSLIIKEVVIQGNKKTCLEVVNHFLQIDTGMVYDSILIVKAKERLKSADLFLKVDIVTLTKRDGVHVYVILIEGLFFTVNDIGGQYFSLKHKQPQFWWRFHMGVEDKNFRGKMEVLSTQVSFWDYRALGMSWQKPLFPSPYYLGISFSVEQRPEEAQRIDHSTLSGRLVLGRKILAHSNVFLGINPIYDKLDVYDSTLQSRTIDVYYELFTSLSSTIDHRNDNFDVNSGWFFYTDIRSNSFYSGSAVPFIQLTNEIRWYIPTYLKDHKFASQVRTQFRDKNTGYVNPLQYGGDGSMRGYSRGEFPRIKTVKDAILFSTEYRFPIYRFPIMRVPVLANYSNVFTALNYRLDGALILDYGRMSSSISDLLNINGDIESGLGIGAGLHMMVPTLEKSVNFDLVWGETPASVRGNMRFSKKPNWYIYVDLHY
jgi:outer membrane protein assembly factor BamA